MSAPRKIPITRPYFDGREREKLLEPLESGWLVQGANVERFEKSVASFVGTEFAIATTSCTTSLHLALVVAGVGPGDQVIVPSFTYVASANAVEYCGATPVLCDIDLETFTLDCRQLAAKVGPATRAIMPVHLFGLSCDMAAVEEIARDHGLAIIEDAACGLGCRYRGTHVGSRGLAGCFSFHPRKPLTTGEGGVITTNRADLNARLRSLRDHGASKSDAERHRDAGGSLLPEFNVLGYNYRMTDLQGALGVAQMEKAAFILEERRAVAARYRALLAGCRWLIAPSEPPGYRHSYQSYVCLVDRGRFPSVEEANRFRNRLMRYLEEHGVSVRQGTHAVHTLGYYAKKYGIEPGDLPRSFEADRLTLSLPLYVGLTEDDQAYVVEQIQDGHRAVTAS